MLKVELTKNYAGVTISGDYNDFDYLYDAISYYLSENTSGMVEYEMQNHIYGFLYDVRHAYQGDREAKLVDNFLQENKMKWLNIKKKDVTSNNLYYSFNYLLTDIILDIILMKYFVSLEDKKNTNIYNPYYNMVNYFYSLVINSLEGFLTTIKYNKVKRKFEKTYIDDNIYIPQWFENISIDYANMNKQKREKEIMHILSAIFDYIQYPDYLKMKKEVEKFCKENNCSIEDVNYGKNYPEEIDW